MNSDNEKKANRKKQGREVAEGKRKTGWVDNGNNRSSKKLKSILQVENIKRISRKRKGLTNDV